MDRDAGEKDPNSWIAVRRKMTKHTLDAIRKNTGVLQDALYTRSWVHILSQVSVSEGTNRVGEGPSDKALRQALEYADKLEEYAREQAELVSNKERGLEREMEEEADRLEEALAADGASAPGAFQRRHPVEKSRRRLYVKVKLRRAAALEGLGKKELVIEELRAVLRVEPKNLDAKDRLKELDPPEQGPALAPPPPPPKRGFSAKRNAAGSGQAGVSGGDDAPSGGAFKPPPRSSSGMEEEEGDEGTEEEEGAEALASLLESAAAYLRKQDYAQALQMYNYVLSRRRAQAGLSAKGTLSPLARLKALTNVSLCRQKLRGKPEDLVTVCGEALELIEQLRQEAGRGEVEEVPEETLKRMECAALSRRGWAYTQLRQTVEGEQDALRVKELLGALESG